MRWSGISFQSAVCSRSWLIIGNEVFPSESFADLFPSSMGRPSLRAEVVASVLVLQTLQGMSDREAVAAVRCDIRWKVACDLPFGS